MPNIYTACNWNMGAAQLVTPTTSQLAMVNSIQAAITASTHWTVNSTGTTSTGYKYVEARPSNVNSIYKDYRVLFVERVNTATNKSYSTNNPFNSTAYIPVYFCPDGGASYVTFTPANIDTANSTYVGTRYRLGTSSASSYVWGSIAGTTWTATWLYECEGAMWLVSRASATSYQMIAIGSCFVPSRSTLVDYNEQGTEVGLPCLWNTTAAMTSATIVGGGLFNGSMFWWYQTAPNTKSAVGGTATVVPIRAPTTSFNATSAQAYYSSAGGAVFPASLNGYYEVSVSANAGNTAFVPRGVYLGANMQTRTTIQTGSPLATIGYTFLADDTAVATSAGTLTFINTP